MVTIDVALPLRQFPFCELCDCFSEERRPATLPRQQVYWCRVQDCPCHDPVTVHIVLDDQAPEGLRRFVVGDPAEAVSS